MDWVWSCCINFSTNKWIQIIRLAPVVLQWLVWAHQNSKCVEVVAVVDPSRAGWRQTMTPNGWWMGWFLAFGLPHQSNTTWFVQRRIWQSWSRSRPIWYAHMSKRMCDTFLGPGECCRKGSVGQTPWEEKHVTATLQRFPLRLTFQPNSSVVLPSKIPWVSPHFLQDCSNFGVSPTYETNPDGQAMQTWGTSRTAGQTCGHQRRHAGWSLRRSPGTRRAF